MLAVSRELRAKLSQLKARSSKLAEENSGTYKRVTQQAMIRITEAGIKNKTDQLNEIKSKIVKSKI
ncbi:MAG TPA: hypothetical protein VGQ59_14730 [Cyclobacteriaceae bacterium]|jgi:hypothetical protein|nr:hypothetical protein [Cyclobacteriaceae bacterium]